MAIANPHVMTELTYVLVHIEVVRQKDNQNMNDLDLGTHL